MLTDSDRSKYKHIAHQTSQSQAMKHRNFGHRVLVFHSLLNRKYGDVFHPIGLHAYIVQKELYNQFDPFTINSYH